MTALERLVTLPGVRHAIDFARDLPVPVPVRLFDGAKRTGTPRLWLLLSVWRRIPRGISAPSSAWPRWEASETV